MKKLKLLIVLLCTGFFLMALTACSNSDSEDSTNNDNKDTAESDTALEKNVLAYLNAAIKGEAADEEILDTQTVQDLQDYHLNLVDTLAFRCLYAAAPAAVADSPSGDYLAQSQALWEDVLKDTRYEITQIKEENEEYILTLQTEQMCLYEEMYPILAGYMAQNSDDLQNSIHDMILTACTEAYARVTYREAETTITILTVKEDGTCSISADNLDVLLAQLVDLDSIDTQFNGTLAENLITEASPKQEYPEDLDAIPEYSVGESFILQENGEDVVRLSIDSVKVTEERSEYVSENPDKVVVIAYTYQNLGSEEPLLFGQMSFQVLDGETVCEPYYLPDEITAEQAEKDGNAVSANMSYGVSADSDEIIVYFESSQITSRFKITAPID